MDSIFWGLAASRNIIHFFGYGRDLADAAIYPAVNDLPNALTVTSTFADGRLPKESNFGEFVDIGVPAEAMNATGIDYEKNRFQEQFCSA